MRLVNTKGLTSIGDRSMTVEIHMARRIQNYKQAPLLLLAKLPTIWTMVDAYSQTNLWWHLFNNPVPLLHTSFYRVIENPDVNTWFNYRLVGYNTTGIVTVVHQLLVEIPTVPGTLWHRYIQLQSRYLVARTVGVVAYSLYVVPMDL